MEPDGLTGRRIASARRDAHLSQRALAAELGVSLRTVQNYESGTFIPYRHFEALSRLVRRSPAWLLQGRRSDRPDQLLARAQQQQQRLQRNLDRLVELRDQHATNGEALLESSRSRHRRTKPPY